MDDDELAFLRELADDVLALAKEWAADTRIETEFGEHLQALQDKLGERIETVEETT